MLEFPQIHESDAVDEPVSLYATLRQTTGVPTVNLIWRHFAALPGTERGLERPRAVARFGRARCRAHPDRRRHRPA